MKRCSENMLQIYRRTPIPMYDFNKVYWNHTSAWVFSSKFAAYFLSTFYQEHLRTAASVFIRTRIFDLNFKVIISDNHFSLKNVLIQYDTFPFPKHLLSFRSRKSHLFYRIAVLKSLGKFPMKTSKMKS